MGGLPGEYLCEGAAAAPGGVCHHLLPARLSPSEREQIEEILSKGKVWVAEKESVQLERGLLMERFNSRGKGCMWLVWLHITRLGMFLLHWDVWGFL